jgi:SAM-dependent methyltransferase
MDVDTTRVDELTEFTADMREQVRQQYADAAGNVESSCCDSDCCTPTTAEAYEVTDFGKWLYQADELSSIPDGAVLASLGCGNPTAVADLKQGETVLDLGSGAGIDVLLSARRVGPTGFVYGLDMTDEMLELARNHQAEDGANNVEFRKGVIEDIPLQGGAVDVVISNCVINLSTDKPAVFSEMHRVLKVSGRIGIADVVADNELSEAQRFERGSWIGCIAGALSFADYENGLANAGFTGISIEPTHVVAEGMHSAIIKAVKS